jgi:RimJ/RimL family protein N-acetyltransferase
METRTFGELLIDLEEEPAARAVIWGLLRRWSVGSGDSSGRVAVAYYDGQTLRPLPLAKPSTPLCDEDLCLSVPRKADAPRIVEHARHPDMEGTYWLPGKPAVTEEAAEQLVDDLLRGWDGDGPHGAGLFIRRGEVIVGLVLIGNDPEEIELGYGVAPAFRSQGLATRACRLVVEWLDGLGESRDLTIRTSPDNEASVKVADNLGFELMGVETTASDNAGEYRQAVYKRASRGHDVLGWSSRGSSRADRRVLGAPGNPELRGVADRPGEERAAKSVICGLLREMERK